MGNCGELMVHRVWSSDPGQRNSIYSPRSCTPPHSARLSSLVPSLRGKLECIRALTSIHVWKISPLTGMATPIEPEALFSVERKGFCVLEHTSRNGNQRPRFTVRHSGRPAGNHRATRLIVRLHATIEEQSAQGCSSWLGMRSMRWQGSKLRLAHNHTAAIAKVTVVS